MLSVLTILILSVLETKTCLVRGIYSVTHFTSIHYTLLLVSYLKLSDLPQSFLACPRDQCLNLVYLFKKTPQA